MFAHLQIVSQLTRAKQQIGAPDFFATEPNALWDTYPHADFVMYPSLIEGFGNALIETIYFQKPALVNRYAVYAADIASLGFRFVEIDGAVTDAAIDAVRAYLSNPDLCAADVAHNDALGLQHYSYRALDALLSPKSQLEMYSR